MKQFEAVLQKMAHKIAVEAVKTLNKSSLSIKASGSRLLEVYTGDYSFNFNAATISFSKRSPSEWMSFQLEEKLYTQSNHCTRVSFYAEDDKLKETKKKIEDFIDKIMAEASIKPVPRFTLAKFTGGQRYLDLTNKTASTPA